MLEFTFEENNLFLKKLTCCAKREKKPIKRKNHAPAPPPPPGYQMARPLAKSLKKLVSLQMTLRPFFFIDWFTDPPTLLFGKLKKKKIENPYFLFPPLLIFILIMYRKNKNNKKSTLVPQ